MVMVRGGRSSGSFGGGRSSSYSHGDKERIIYTKSPSSAFTSSAIGVRGPGPRDSVQIQHGHDYILGLPFHYRCQTVMKSLENLMFPALRSQDNKLSLGDAIVYNEYLVNCPDVPDLRKLSENDEINTPAYKKHRCEKLLRERAKMLSQQNQELTASQNAFFEAWLDSCCNCPAA